jgi:hypothetical protein
VEVGKKQFAYLVNNGNLHFIDNVLIVVCITRIR